MNTPLDRWMVFCIILWLNLMSTFTNPTAIILSAVLGCIFGLAWIWNSKDNS